MGYSFENCLQSHVESQFKNGKKPRTDSGSRGQSVQGSWSQGGPRRWEPSNPRVNFPLRFQLRELKGHREPVTLVPATCSCPVSRGGRPCVISAGENVPLLEERKTKSDKLLCPAPDITGGDQRGCASGFGSQLRSGPAEAAQGAPGTVPISEGRTTSSGAQGRAPGGFLRNSHVSFPSVKRWVLRSVCGGIVVSTRPKDEGRAGGAVTRAGLSCSAVASSGATGRHVLGAAVTGGSGGPGVPAPAPRPLYPHRTPSHLRFAAAETEF